MAAITIAEAVAALRRGAVIAYPTEAVWGLGCDPFDEGAVLRLLALKQRPVDKGLILVAAARDAFAPLLDWHALSDECREAVFATWPGPHTWVVPAGDRVPRWITGRHDGVAVRVSAHPVVVALCAAFGGPLVSTSANPAGLPAPRTRTDITEDLIDSLDGWVAGDTGGLAAPTDIRDARSGAILRGN
ncbi:MAG: tRNA threonylcarbamoyladenosine biosynthesis protein RimN [Xanthomonadaceae bacterium]|nr:tRNA threonylcarbamoyladenosine biosynthesis protein RimN [Xanthomonadaceae bacterium]